MGPKKSRKANLEKSRGLFFEIGWVTALLLALIAFEWTGSGGTESDILNIFEDQMDIENEFFMLDDEANQETEIDIRPYTEIPVTEEEVEEEVFLIVEKMPRFNGKDQSEFRKYIQEHVQYPQIAVDNGIAGTVYVQFTIDRNGDVTDIKVIRGVDPALDDEAIWVIESSPRCTPGEQRGRPVSVRFTFPIHFILKT